MIQRKVCLVGDFSVGKTSLFNRFVHNRFAESYLSTVGVRLQRKSVVVAERELNLILWDTEGGKDTSALKPSYLGGATGAVIVCDLNRVSSVLHCEAYAQLLRAHNPQIKLSIAGNKRDLLPDEHAHLAVAQQVAQLIGAPLTLTSARSGVGVEDLFKRLERNCSVTNLANQSHHHATPQFVALGVAFIACDAALRVTEASAAAAALLGEPIAAMAGRPLTEVCLPLASSDLQLRALCAGRLPHLALEQINVEAADGTRYVSLVVLPHHDGLLVSIRDVTVQSLQQQRLQQQHHELLLLHETVAFQNQQLTAVNRELTDLSQRKSDMLAIATHDLRSPLTTTIGYAEMLLEGLLGDMTEQQNRSLEAIARQGRHMLELINTLLDVRRLDVDELHSRYPLDLDGLLGQVARSFTDQTALAHVQLRYRPRAEAITVLGDRDLLQQAVVNLVSNGIKYTGKGGTVTLDLQCCASPPPGAAHDAARHWCAVSVADTGPGIAAADVQRIFDPFFRTQDAKRKGLPGSGLGLSIVQNVARRHAGHIEVTSQLGVGTTFTFYLPVHAGDSS